MSNLCSWLCFLYHETHKSVRVTNRGLKRNEISCQVALTIPFIQSHICQSRWMNAHGEGLKDERYQTLSIEDKVSQQGDHPLFTDFLVPAFRICAMNNR